MKKNAFTYIVLSIFIALALFLFVQNHHNCKKYDKLQDAISNITKEEDDTRQEYNYDTSYSLSINQINSEISNLKNEINDIKDICEDSQNKSIINNLQNSIDELSKKYTTLPNYSNDIAILKKQIETLSKDNTSSNMDISNVSIAPKFSGKWKTSTLITQYSPEKHIPSNVVSTTVYEFKENGDFYINDIKVGTYSFNSILFKDSNDINYRTGIYYFNEKTLYINLYYDGENIVSSTELYQCENIQ